jgi:hypothetical protein
MSLSSATSFYRNSEPDLSENYFAFGRENQGHTNTVEMNYAEFQTKSPVEIPIASETVKDFPIQLSCKLNFL